MPVDEARIQNYAICTRCIVLHTFVRTEYNIQEFVDNYIPIDTSNIENWTDDMLAYKMDEAFFRMSMFDNYIVSSCPITD